jgi:hypothetical protein
MAKSSAGRPRKEVDYADDPYMQTIRAEGDEGRGGDEDSEDDEDFAPKAESSSEYALAHCVLATANDMIPC